MFSYIQTVFKQTVELFSRFFITQSTFFKNGLKIYLNIFSYLPYVIFYMIMVLIILYTIYVVVLFIKSKNNKLPTDGLLQEQYKKYNPMVNFLNLLKHLIIFIGSFVLVNKVLVTLLFLIFTYTVGRNHTTMTQIIKQNVKNDIKEGWYRVDIKLKKFSQRFK